MRMKNVRKLCFLSIQSPLASTIHYVIDMMMMLHHLWIHLPPPQWVSSFHTRSTLGEAPQSQRAHCHTMMTMTMTRMTRMMKIIIYEGDCGQHSAKLLRVNVPTVKITISHNDAIVIKMMMNMSCWFLTWWKDKTEVDWKSNRRKFGWSSLSVFVKHLEGFFEIVLWVNLDALSY